MALLEAMAHGLAPLVADGPGNRETVAAAGVLFAAGDREAMAARVGELAADPRLRERLGAAARERVGPSSASSASAKRPASSTRRRWRLRAPDRGAGAAPA